jgi:hypothetical protein
VHCLKRLADFPVPSWDVTNPTLPGLKLFNYSPPGRVVLVSDIPAGDGKIINHFYSVWDSFYMENLTVLQSSSHTLGAQFLIYSFLSAEHTIFVETYVLHYIIP